MRMSWIALVTALSITLPLYGDSGAIVAKKKRNLKPQPAEKVEPKANDDGVYELSFKKLDQIEVLKSGKAPLDILDHLPAWLEQLEGKRIQIRGVMLPEFKAKGLRAFYLAKDVQIGNFGRQAKVHELIPVWMPKGKTTDYSKLKIIEVEGTFHIIPPKPDDEVLLRLFEIRDAKVIAAKRR